jgi:hypothetical protein
MPKRREVIPVDLSDEQRDKLERLWFYFGNYGAKTTPGNHSFIQRLLENGIDERPLYTKRTPKSEIPTPECVLAVEAILSTNAAPASDKPKPTHLRVISNPTERKRPDQDPELKAILEDMNRRYRVNRERAAVTDDDTPDAA